MSAPGTLVSADASCQHLAIWSLFSWRRQTQPKASHAPTYLIARPLIPLPGECRRARSWFTSRRAFPHNGDAPQRGPPYALPKLARVLRHEVGGCRRLRCDSMATTMAGPHLWGLLFSGPLQTRGQTPPRPLGSWRLFSWLSQSSQPTPQTGGGEVATCVQARDLLRPPPLSVGSMQTPSPDTP